MKHGKLFFETYISGKTGLRVLDIGSQNVNGSLSEVMPAGNTYVGADFQEARGVDVVLSDPYSLPFEDGEFDVCVSSSCFEHSEFFWLVFEDIMRILKPEGLFYLNAPSNGDFHRYPVDCWRFYPDAGQAMVNWAKRQDKNPQLLECFTGNQENDIWNDYVAVFVQDASKAHLHPNRITTNYRAYSNGMLAGSDSVSQMEGPTEDVRKWS